MGKLNAKKWIERFEMLSPESQLEVADAIERELHLNNEFPSDDDNYDDVKGKELEGKYSIEKGNIRDILLAKVNNEKLKIRIEKINGLISRFKNLDIKHQNMLIDEMLEPLEEVLRKNEKSQGFDICLKEGHIWKWKKGSREEEYTWYPPDITDLGHPDTGKKEWIEVPIWVRDCERCGWHEEREYNDVPDEIKAERKKQAAINKENKRQRDIKKKEKQLLKIQQEIAELKGQNK